MSDRLSCPGPPEGAHLLRHSKEHTMSVTTIDPPGRATAGIDWAIDGHVISIVDPSGTETRRASVPHTIAGLRRLVRLLHEA